MTLAYSNSYFKVEHCDDCCISGHLIIRPLREVNSITELSEDALALLGKTLALSYRVVNDIIRPEKIYTLSFCEVLPALHFHVFPRNSTLTQEYNRAHHLENTAINGALFFDWARKQGTKEDNHAALQEAINAAFIFASSLSDTT